MITFSFLFEKDPQQNQIRQWVNVTLENGLFSGDFLLSKQTLLGDWQLTVTPSTGSEVRLR